MLIAQKVNFIPTSFMRYCKYFANLLFWVLLAGMAILNKINGMSLMFIWRQNINFTPPCSFSILQRYSRVAILDTLGMPRYDQ